MGTWRITFYFCMAVKKVVRLDRTNTFNLMLLTLIKVVVPFVVAVLVV